MKTTTCKICKTKVGEKRNSGLLLNIDLREHIIDNHPEEAEFINSCYDELAALEEIKIQLKRRVAKKTGYKL